MLEFLDTLKGLSLNLIAYLFILGAIILYFYGLIYRVLAITTPVAIILAGFSGFIIGKINGTEVARKAYEIEVQNEQKKYLERYLVYSNELKTLEVQYQSALDALSQSVSIEELNRSIIAATAPFVAKEITDEKSSTSCLITTVPSGVMSVYRKTRDSSR